MSRGIKTSEINVDYYHYKLCMMQIIHYISGVKRDEAIAVRPKMVPQSAGAAHTLHVFNGSITTACHEIAMAAIILVSFSSLERARRANKVGAQFIRTCRMRESV